LKVKELEGLAQARDALKKLVDLGYMTKEESALVFLGFHHVVPRALQGGEIAYVIAQEVADRAKVRESSP
jgi:hypothetical protein